MSKKTLIYTEGKSDKNFLSWCLDVWKNEDHFDQAHFDIIYVEGKDKLFSDEFCKRIENILKNVSFKRSLSFKLNSIKNHLEI